MRQATHDFLTDLVIHCQENPDTYNFKIEDQVWYHKDYENDRTICNIIRNYVSIKNWIDNFAPETIVNLLKFVEDKVELSYFDIENGREGEELYIYMNSRGRQLEANETLKAKFLAKVKCEEDKLEWGKKWENWQDFFWKHRGISPDADAGFNEFLRMIQIINMCDLGKTPDQVSDFASGRSTQKLAIDLLPNTLDEVDKYFQAYKWLVETEQVIKFFAKYEAKEFLTKTNERKLIDYFRILPSLALLAKTGFRDEETIIRFIRFIYNVARKENLAKDIGGQLPIAVRLMLEYGSSNKGGYDVCDLIAYQKGRTVVIDEEEVLKLSLYKSPPAGSTRQELEPLFWVAEDHPIFNGEITFLLDKHYDKEQQTIDLSSYKKTWASFRTLFPSGDTCFDALITKALLYYGNTWIRVSPFYYNNYNCQDWFALVRNEAGKHLRTLLEELQGQSADYLDIIIKRRIKKYFIVNGYNSIESLKSKDDFYTQVRLLVAIDYYSNKILWEHHGYIAEDQRYTFKDIPFFNKDRVIYNVGRYIRDGSSGRVIHDMRSTLHDEAKLKQILADILSFED